MPSLTNPILKNAEAHLERSCKLIEMTRVHCAMLHRQIERAQLLLTESRRLLEGSAHVLRPTKETC